MSVLSLRTSLGTLAVAWHLPTVASKLAHTPTPCGPCQRAGINTKNRANARRVLILLQFRVKSGIEFHGRRERLWSGPRKGEPKRARRWRRRAHSFMNFSRQKASARLSRHHSAAYLPFGQ